MAFRAHKVFGGVVSWTRDGMTTLTGTLVKTNNITGTLVKTGLITGVMTTSQVRPSEIYMRLAASDDQVGEQLINITTVDTIEVTALPLLNNIVEGQLGTWRVTLVAKTHSSQPTSIDIELFDTDAPDNPQDIFVTPVPGSKSLAQSLATDVDNVQGDPLTVEEGMINRAFASMRTFNTKGTAGSLGMAIRINGGSGIDYDFLVSVNGKALRSS